MVSLSSKKPRLSIIIPTRERGAYLGSAIETCLANPDADLEVIILDNASTDETKEIVNRFDQERVRYFRSSERLSMRQNFERGIDYVRGEFMCFIGDDDGLLPFSAKQALSIFDDTKVSAIACNRAHYAWPDLQSGRRNTALVPRKKGISFYNSKDQLKTLLIDENYYRLPCIYHGFVKTSLVQKIRERDNGFFHSSQVDIYSSIALSMEDITYAYSESPLIINGGSSRSNGASHFGGGSEIEKNNWKKEDEIGFLNGFEDYATVGSLIIESALRFADMQNLSDIFGIFEPNDIIKAFLREESARLALGRDVSNLTAAIMAAGIAKNEYDNYSYPTNSPIARLRTLISAFLKMRPINTHARGVNDVNGAAQMIASFLQEDKMGLLSDPIGQISAANQIAFSRNK
jgi:glycosyltransferase involved in cell wall biosynthesis